MAKDKTKFAVRKLVKAYFLFNKGREVTSREICNWLNNPENNFGLKTNIAPNYISRMINHSRHNSSSILFGIERTCEHPMKYRLQ